MKAFYTIFWLAMATFTAIVGHAIHGGVFWSVMNFIFWPFSWIKWLIFQQVSISIIKHAFEFLFK